MDSAKKALLEAILFTTTRPLTVSDIKKILKIQDSSIENMLEELKKKYSSEDSGITMSQIGGHMLIVKPEYADKVSHLTPHSDLSRGLLRVLSIIAYHEPISQSDIVKVVGNRTYEYTKELRQRGLIKAEKKSRTVLLSTTPQFEEYFGTRKEVIKKIAKDVEEDAKIEEKREHGEEEKLEGEGEQQENQEEK